MIFAHTRIDSGSNTGLNQVGLCLVWTLPLKPASQDAAIQVCHALDAWVSLDVFMIVLLIANFDFERMTGYAMQHGSMSEGCDWMKSHLAFECLVPSVSLCEGFALVAAAAIATHVIPKVALRACRNATTHRDEASARSRASSALAAVAAAGQAGQVSEGEDGSIATGSSRAPLVQPSSNCY
ncbi:unnamed protein product [Polarella glacialis]|uniref:Uncharacterized protein n=1 Tax=Polarella glacialis TaxID=89957 RepID=A0A813DKI7_POLGL|nr:unnamed protein product [Polarella glacialis]